jgi:hypothetical protein
MPVPTGTGSAGLSQTVKEETAGEGVAVAGLNAVPIVGPALAAIGSIVLGAHVAKLKDATSENEAVDTAIPAFDTDFQQLSQAVNSGAYTAAQALVAAKTMSNQLYTYFHSLVGSPGTAWGAGSTPLPCGAPSQSTAKCDSGCTVGCCIYNNCVAQPMNCLETFLASATPGATTTIPVPEIYPGKYSTYTRPAYTVTLTIPQPPSAVSSILGGESASGTGSEILGAASAALGGGTNFNLTTIAVYFVIAVLVAVVAGIVAAKVK